MTPVRTLATTRRVLLQVRHDRRTVGLLVGIPVVMMGLLSWMYSDRADAFDHIGAALLGVFPLIVMFLITSVATLRERQSGTLERLMTLPLSRADIVFGYALAFTVLAVAQALVVSAFSLTLFGLDIGPVWAVITVALLDGLLGMALGLFTSAFARTEFQAVQFMPAVVSPQILLCGLFLPTDQLPRALEAISAALPMTYAVSAMDELTRTGFSGGVARDMLVVAAFVAAALTAGVFTLRRRTP